MFGLYFSRIEFNLTSQRWEILCPSFSSTFVILSLISSLSSIFGDSIFGDSALLRLLFFFYLDWVLFYSFPSVLFDLEALRLLLLLLGDVGVFGVLGSLCSFLMLRRLGEIGGSLIDYFFLALVFL